MELGRKLMNVRLDRRLTRTELAELVGVSTSAISKIETSKGYPPSARLLFQIADALDVSVDFLLDETIPYSSEIRDEPERRNGARMSLTRTEAALVKQWRKAPPETRRFVLKVLTWSKGKVQDAIRAER